MSDQIADRIERALTRIEHAAARRAGETAHLARRHARLRDRVETAIAELDALIAQELGIEDGDGAENHAEDGD